MTKVTTASTTVSPVPDWRTVLGLVEPKDADWGRVRAEQINVIQKLAPVRLVTNLLGIACVVAVLLKKAPPIQLGGWALGLGLLAAFSAFHKLRHRTWQYQTATLRELHRETLLSTAIAIGWGILPLVFGKYCGPSELMLVWAAVTTMMAAAAFGMSAAPLATAFYLIVLGGSVSTMAWSLHLPWVAATGALFTFGLTGCCLYAGRTFVIHEAAGLALAEKTEVVSLRSEERRVGKECA